MAEKVEFDPEGYGNGTRAIGDAKEGLPVVGAVVSGALSRLAPSLGSDGYAQSFLDKNKGRAFADNLDAMHTELMPQALESLHDGMTSVQKAFEATEDASERRFT